MYLRDIAFAASHYAKFPLLRTKKAFHLSTHHVQEIFSHFMPRKYMLDGMVKTNIILGPMGPQDRQYVQLIDVNEYHYVDFSMAKYFRMRQRDREEWLLRIIEESLLDIAKRHGAELEPIRIAAGKTRECGFRLSFENGNSKWTRSRKARAVVRSTYKLGGKDLHVELVDRNGQVLSTRQVVRSHQVFLIPHEKYRTRWEGNDFVFLDRGGNVVERVDFSKAMRRLEGAPAIRGRV